MNEFASLDMWTITKVAAVVAWTFGFFLIGYLSPLEKDYATPHR